MSDGDLATQTSEPRNIRVIAHRSRSVACRFICYTVLWFEPRPPIYTCVASKQRRLITAVEWTKTQANHFLSNLNIKRIKNSLSLWLKPGLWSRSLGGQNILSWSKRWSGALSQTYEWSRSWGRLSSHRVLPKTQKKAATAALPVTSYHRKILTCLCLIILASNNPCYATCLAHNRPTLFTRGRGACAAIEAPPRYGITLATADFSNIVVFTSSFQIN